MNDEHVKKLLAPKEVEPPPNRQRRRLLGVFFRRKGHRVVMPVVVDNQRTHRPSCGYCKGTGVVGPGHPQFPTLRGPRRCPGTGR